MRFKVTFHGPFHVATGVPEKGVDRPVDRNNPLPSSSLKGLMRAAAVHQLNLDHELIDEVFGVDPARQGRQPARLSGSPWWWSDAQFESRPAVTNVARIRRDDKTGTAARGFVMFGEHVWAETAIFEVEQIAPSQDLELHEIVLKGSALAVISVGGQRRRGEGWVTVSTDDWRIPHAKQLLLKRRKED